MVLMSDRLRLSLKNAERLKTDVKSSLDRRIGEDPDKEDIWGYSRKDLELVVEYASEFIKSQGLDFGYLEFPPEKVKEQFKVYDIHW